MVEILGHRRKIRIFASIVIFVFFIPRDINGSRGGQVLATKMKLESFANASRYRWIERSMKNHLRSEREADSSLLHVLIHPKVNPRLSESVLRACSSSKPSLIWRYERSSGSIVCPERRITCSRVTRVVGIYEEVDDIKPLEWRNSYGAAWNPRSKIAIWLGRSTGSDETTDKVKFEEILETFWSINAINVVLLSSPWCRTTENCTDSWRPRVFGYNPFPHKNSHTKKRGKLLELSFEDSLFPDKLKNLQGLPIRVSMYQQEPHVVLVNFTKLGSGIGVETLRYMEKWLNFTVELVSSPTTFTSYSIQLPGGENLGPIGDILKNRSVYLANWEYVQSTIGKRLEFLRPFGRAYAKFIVPPAGLMPGIFRIVRSVDVSVVGATFFNSLFLIVYFVARKKRHPFFRTYRLLVHQQIEDISEHSSERIFLMGWIVWAFIIVTAVQSQLIKDLTDPPFYRSIDTLQELIASPLTLMLEQVDINSLKNSDVEVKNRLAEKSILEDKFARCMEILLHHRNVSCAIDAAFIDQIVRNINKKHEGQHLVGSGNRRGQEIVHVAKETLIEYWRTMVVQEGFPYLDKFNVALDKIVEFGLSRKWYAESSRKHFRPQMAIHPKLSMQHFEGTFKILLIGICFAVGALLAEIVVHHAKRRLKGQTFVRAFRDAANRSCSKKSQSRQAQIGKLFERMERK